MFFPLSRASVVALNHGFDFIHCVLAYLVRTFFITGFRITFLNSHFITRCAGWQHVGFLFKGMDEAEFEVIL